MITRHQVFEVTIESGTVIPFVWNRRIVGCVSNDKVLDLLDEEIEESRQHELNQLGNPTLVELHQRYRALVDDYGLPGLGSKHLDYMSYGVKVGSIHVTYEQEVIQIGDA